MSKYAYKQITQFGDISQSVYDEYDNRRYEEYKSLNGLDNSVIEFLESKEEVKFFFENVRSLIEQSCREYQRRGFSNLSVYFGCTGGQHRSVFLAQKLANYLKNKENIKVNIQHIEQNL